MAMRELHFSQRQSVVCKSMIEPHLLLLVTLFINLFPFIYHTPHYQC